MGGETSEAWRPRFTRGLRKPEFPGCQPRHPGWRSSVSLSTICLRQIDVLSRPKDDALPGLDIGRHSPQPQSHVERIDAECGPEGKLADPMLFRMAGGARRNG